MSTDYFGPMWEGSPPAAGFQLMRYSNRVAVDITANEMALLMTGLHNAINDLKVTGYGHGDKLAAEYRELLEKLRAI